MTYSEEMAKKTRTPMKFERDKVLSVRLTEAEQEEIRQASEHAGMRPGQFIRVYILEKARAVNKERK